MSSDFSKAKAGDPVVVFRQRTDPKRTFITKMGRKYFYVNGETRSKFLISNGQIEGMYGLYVMTPEDVIKRDAMTDMVRNLSQKGVEIPYQFQKYNHVRAVYVALKICLELPEVKVT